MNGEVTGQGPGQGPDKVAKDAHDAPDTGEHELAEGVEHQVQSPSVPGFRLGVTWVGPNPESTPEWESNIREKSEHMRTHRS